MDTTNKRRSRSTSRGQSLNFSQEATLLVESQEPEIIEIESEKPRTRRSSSKKPDFIEDEEEPQGVMEEEEDDFSPKAKKSSHGDHCQVCYSTVSRKFLHGDSKDLYDLLQCRMCGINVHKVCYGIKTPFDMQVSEKGTSLVKFFLCDHCKEGDSSQSLKCFICDNKEGCLRRSTDNKWFHTLCVIGSPKITFKDITTMSVDLSGFRKNTQKIPVSRKCRICSNRIQTFGCINRNSDDHCHLNCALREKFHNPTESEWKISFSLADEEELKVSHCADETDIMKNIRDLSLSLEQVIEKTGMSGSFKKLKATSVRETTSEGKKSRGKSAIEPSKYDKELYETAKNKAQANLNEGLASQQDEEEDDELVGGRVVVIKTVDVDPEDEDLVREDEDDDIEDDLKNVIDYSTPDSLIRIIEDLYKELAPNNNLLEVYKNNQVKVKEDLRDFPKAEKLSFPEVLLFVNVFYKRAQVLVGNLCQISAIEALLKAAKMIPFPLNPLIKSLNTKYFTGLALDSLLQSNIEQCRPESAYEPGKKKFDDVVIQRNANVLEQVSEFETIYLKKPVKVLTAHYEELRILKKQLGFLKKVYDEIADDFNNNGRNRSGRTTATTKTGSSRHETPNKPGPVIVQENFPAIPLSKISELNARAKASHLPEDFQEIQLLKDYVGGKEGLLEIEDLRKEFGSDFSHSGKSSPRGSPRKVFEGSKGIVKIVEVIPAAPETLKTSKRGRPKKAEKTQEELEDEHKEQLKRLLSLPTIKETEEALAKARRGMEFQKMKVFEANLKSVEEWRVDFERAVERNDGTLGGLIEKIEVVDVYVPEMKRAMELRRSWSLWQIKVNEIQRKMKKRVESLFEETGGMVPFKDLEKIIQEGKNVVNLEQDDGVVRKLEEKYKRICQIREEFNSGGRPDFGKLEEWKKEIMEMNVKLPEMSRFVATVAINENLKRDIEDKISLDKLIKKLEGSEYVSERVDLQLFEKLKEKVAEGKRIQDQAKELLKKRGSYEVQEIAKLAQLSRDLLQKKLNIPEESSIDKIVSEFLEFISKVYDVITGGIIEHKITHHTLLTGEYDEDFQRKTINELIEKCKREGHGKLDLEKAREIEKAFEASEVENMKIASLREFYKSLSLPLWKVKAKGLVDAEQKTYQEIQKFINDIPPIEQVSDEDIIYLKKIQQVEKKISAWDKEVKDLLEINSKEHFIALMDEAFKNKTHKETFQKKLDDIVDKMKKPMDQYNKEFYPYSDLDKRIRALKKAIGWVKWISSAIEIRAKIINEDVEKVEYEKIKEMYDKMQKFTLPDSKGLCKQIADWYRGAERVYKDFLSQYEKKRVTLADKKGKENLSMAKLIKKNEDKISIEEAERILEKLKKGTKEVEFPEQVHIIERDLHVLDEWSSKIKEITKKVREGISQQEEEEAVEIELEDGLEREIEELKQRMLQIPIRDEDFERGLEVLDWTYDAARVKTQSITVEILRKLIKYGEKLNIEDRDVQKLLENLKEEHTKAKGLVSFVDKLQKIKSGKVAKKVPYEELLKKREEIEASIVDFSDEKKALNEVYQATRELKEEIEAIFEEAPEEKVEEETLKQLLKKLKKGVVDLGVERKRLEDAIAEGEKLQNDIKKKKRGRDAKWLNQMMERYKESVVYIEQAEKLNQESQELEYNPPKDLPEESEEEEEPVERLTKAKEEKPKREKKSEPKIPKAPKVPKKKRVQGEVNAEKVEEFKKRAELMERRRFGSTLGPRLKISPTEMRKIQEEGERLKELYPEDERLTECADFVREIGGLVEAQVQEIKKVKKMKTLEELEKIGLGFIDFSYTITARKSALNKSPKKKIARESESEESGDDTLRLIPKKKIIREPESESEDGALGLILKKKERRESRSISEERGRLSRERSRERERTPLRKKKPPQSPAKTRSKERTRQELLRNIHQREYERNSLVDYLRRGEEERLATYYEKLINEKASLKSKQVIVAVIKHLLDDCPYIALDFFETFRAANEIYYALPELRQSRELYDTTISRLRAVLSCRFISRSLVELNFAYTHIRNLVHQGPRARQEFEKTLAEQALAKDLAEEEDYFDGIPAHDAISVALADDEDDIYDDRPIQRIQPGSSPIPHSPLISDHGDDEPEPAVIQTTQTDAGTIKIQPITLQPYGKPQQKPQAILYNPDSPKPAEQPDNVSVSDLPSYNPDVVVQKPKKPRNLQNNALIKIFNGTFGFDQNKISPNFNMFATCRLTSKNEIQPDTVLRIPALDGRKTTKLVKVTQWMPTYQFHSDFSQVVQYWRKQDGKIQVIAGWIEPEEPSEAQYFTDLAQNMLDSDKVAVFNYYESAKLIVMNKYQMRRDWALQLNLRVHKTQEDSQHVLLFVIIQDPSRLRSIVPSISPVLVKTLENSSQEDVDNIWHDGSESPKLLEIESTKPQPPKPILKKPQGILGKRPYEESEQEDETIKELANLVKKIKNGDRTTVQTLIDKLKFSSEEDIERLATSVDQESRNLIMNIIKNLYSEEDSSLPRIVPPKPKETLTTTVTGQIKAGGKFTPIKFTPQMTTGSTAASPGRLLQDNTSMKSTPTNLFGERPIESQVYIRDPMTQRNQEAFASLQPSTSNLPIIKPREEMTIYATVGHEEDVFKAINEERKEEEGQESYVKLPLNWSKLGAVNLVLPKVTLNTESELFVVKQSTFEKMIEYKRNRGDFGPTGEQEVEEEVEEGEIQEEEPQEEQEENRGEDLVDFENLFQD